MKIYSYVLRTASGDYSHKILIDKDYKDYVDFMKNEIPGEYEAWRGDWNETWGPFDESTIDYAYFDKKVIEIN